MVKPIPFPPISDPPPSAPRTRSENAATRLRRDILLRRYLPGDRLPPERQLAQRLSTNRNTLREALRILESENLVRARQGDGTIVLDWRSSGEINLLPWFLAEKTPAGERFDSLITLGHLRARLMEEALGRASLDGTVSDMDSIETALRALRDAAPGPDLVRADVELYRQIALASHSLVIVWVFNTFAKIFLELGERFPEAWSNDEDYLAGLALVLRWLRERRRESACEEMRLVFEARGAALAAALDPDGPARKKSRRRGGRA
jgi:GntR family transcriptional regulator, transcriptional repressor for pyruvate dehydrogenase complex